MFFVLLCVNYNQDFTVLSETRNLTPETINQVSPSGYQALRAGDRAYVNQGEI